MERKAKARYKWLGLNTLNQTLAKLKGLAMQEGSPQVRRTAAKKEEKKVVEVVEEKNKRRRRRRRESEVGEG